VLIVTTGASFAGAPARKRQPGDGISPQHHRCVAVVWRHELDAHVAVQVVLPVNKHRHPLAGTFPGNQDGIWPS